MADQNYLKNLDKYIQGNRTRFEDMLGELVEIPTVSMDPERKDDIRRGANLAAEYLRSFGAEATLHETKGNPVVVGRFQVPGAKRTLTIYNHIDVQPAQEPEWVRDPFVFGNENGRFTGSPLCD
jgi:acetylornithine deacetylase/succinyl-diaminopimelate desuccinylase-like protein